MIVPEPIRTTARRLRRSRRWSNSMSAPIWNINKTRPIWLMTFRVRGDVLANSASLRPGSTRPSKDGPSINPAMTSPITPGWPRTTCQGVGLARGQDDHHELHKRHEQDGLGLVQAGRGAHEEPSSGSWACHALVMG